MTKRYLSSSDRPVEVHKKKKGWKLNYTTLSILYVQLFYLEMDEYLIS